MSASPHVASGAAALDGSPWPGVRTWVARTFRGLTWHRFAVFCLALVVITAAQPAAVVALWDRPSGVMPRGLEGLAKAYLSVLLTYFPVLLAVVVSENRGPQRGRARLASLAFAVVGGQAIGLLLWFWSVPVLYPNGYLRRTLGPMSGSAEWLRHLGGWGLMHLAMSAAAASLYVLVRRQTDAARELHDAQVAHERTQHENAEARLQVMQAQVEPHFLFNSLASVRRLYQTDAQAGHAMLDHFIDYLAASLPAMRESESTVKREVALAVAYLEVQKIRMGSRLAFAVDVPRALENIVIPPLMVATLVENAVMHGLGPMPAGGTITITVREIGDNLAIVVADDGRGLVDKTWGGGVGLANVRARLRSSFGDGARLVLEQRDPRGVQAVIELPLSSLPVAGRE
jgi:sensor histidine kinase YesM